MRGSKAKAIRRTVRSIVGDDAANAETGYEVITHPPKMRMSLDGQKQSYNPRQWVVKSPFRRMVLDTKKAFAAIREGSLNRSDLQFA